MDAAMESRWAGDEVLKRIMKSFVASMAFAAMTPYAQADILGDLPDVTHAWAVHDPNRPRPPVVAVVAGSVPSDAVVLLDGTEATYRANWKCSRGGGAAPWKFENGEIVSLAGNIETTRSFGDCQLHVEWCAPDDENPQHGNSGVYLMGLYEVQIINSHEIAPGRYHEIIRSADEQAGSIYGQKPPLVNPIRRPGESQTYDIVFHQPIHASDGRLLHPGTLTVFFNGVLVQDCRELEGPTLYMQRAADCVHADRAPLKLQDHDGNVRFRNVWLRELASSWCEDVVSGTSVACPRAVARQRRQTAQKILEELDGIDDDFERLMRALEMLTYSTEKPFLDAATVLAERAADALEVLDAAERQRRVAQLRRCFGKMAKGGCLPADWRLVAAVEQPQLPKISVFANAIGVVAQTNGIGMAESARLFYAAGVRGFDAKYDDPRIPELIDGRLTPVNLFGWVRFRTPDGGRAQSEAFVAKAVRYNVPRIMVIPDDFSPDGDMESEFRVTVEGLRRLAKMARAKGIVPMIEDYGGEANPCSYTKYLKRYLEEIPELSYALDAGNFHYAGRGEDILEMMRFAEGRIEHVHLKDFAVGSNRLRASLGLGVIPNEVIVQTMLGKGYDNWITLEDLFGDKLIDVNRQVAVVRLWARQAK